MCKKDLKILSINIQGAKPYNYTTTIDKVISKNASKWLSLYHYAKQHDYSIIIAQETKSVKQGDLQSYMDSALRHDLKYYAKVVESVNIANPNQGGTAIICLDPSINFKLSDVDTLHNVTWATQMSQIKRDAIEEDSIYGKWVVASFEWNELEINIASIYAPTCVSKPGVTGISSHIAREKPFGTF